MSGDETDQVRKFLLDMRQQAIAQVAHAEECRRKAVNMQMTAQYCLEYLDRVYPQKKETP